MFSRSYSNIYIVEDRNYWESCKPLCNRKDDLVLCIDFGLKKQLTEEGYHVEYVDHYQPKETFRELNVQMHQFLHKWHLDKQDKPMLMYKGYNIGDAMLLNILNDITFFSHFFINFIGLKNLYQGSLFIATNQEIEEIFQETKIPFSRVQKLTTSSFNTYWFNVSQWMNEKVKLITIRRRVKNLIAYLIDIFFGIADKFRNKNLVYIYIHSYFTTFPIISWMAGVNSIQPVKENYSGISKLLNERRVFYRNWRSSKNKVPEIYNYYASSVKREWKIAEYDIAKILYQRIDNTVSEKIKNSIDIIESQEKYFSKRILKLMIPVTNLGMSNRLLMQYCFQQQIPVYLIINGLLTLSFWNDARDSTWINCYSDSIRKDYFNNIKNALPLGDPRMDSYYQAKQRALNYEKPHIVVGTSAFNPLDLNSYLSVEFDFVFDILNTLYQLKQNGREFTVSLKVRSNTYAQLYYQLVDEFFSDMKIKIYEQEPFYNIITMADLYITFYSQTVFEASCLGIPVIYYKNDTQESNQPFDGKSELVTANTTDDLFNYVTDFYEKRDTFNEFKLREVMQKYVGPLDGKNTSRNIEFIETLLETEKSIS
jgi:hypothetical protein